MYVYSSVLSGRPPLAGRITFQTDPALLQTRPAGRCIICFGSEGAGETSGCLLTGLQCMAPQSVCQVKGEVRDERPTFQECA